MTEKPVNPANCTKCNTHLCAKLIEDNPGQHVYILACPRCHLEFGNEWVVYHHANEPAAIAA